MFHLSNVEGNALVIINSCSSSWSILIITLIIVILIIVLVHFPNLAFLERKWICAQNFTSASGGTLNKRRRNHLIDGVLMHPAQNFTRASGGTLNK